MALLFKLRILMLFVLTLQGLNCFSSQQAEQERIAASLKVSEEQIRNAIMKEREEADRGDKDKRFVPALPLTLVRVAMVREKYLENEIFPGQGKAREFCGWPGKFRKDLESQGKVREFENK